MFGIASIVGPILGGALTDSHLTWRWYVKIPVRMNTSNKDRIGVSGLISPLEEPPFSQLSCFSQTRSASTQSLV
jgi:hypothetical protein